MSVCEAAYHIAILVKEGIQVLDQPFDDGVPPSSQIFDKQLKLVKKKFPENPESCIVVHSAAGLGRTSVLVA